MGKARKPPVYLVAAVHWQYDGGLNKVNVRAEGDPCRPLRAFRDRPAAEAFAAKREDAKRKAESPLRFLMTLEERFSDVSSKSHEEMLAWLRENGFPLPGADALSDWWEEVSAGLTPDRRKLLWDQFDKIRFYEVLEVPFEGG
jgi:hypothetical protein